MRYKSVHRLNLAQAQQLCQAVPVPVLAALASDGSFIKKLAHIQNWYRQLTVEQISGGHHCHMIAAKEVTRLIRAWL